jgi:hypothetical protein
MYVTTPKNQRRFSGQRDRLENAAEPRYLFLRGFFALRSTISACSFGGVFNMRRSTSSPVSGGGSRPGFGVVMVGV